MEQVYTKYHCDMCNTECKQAGNSNTVKSLEDGPLWRRVHVRLVLRSGINNNAKERPADLCDTCAHELLLYAIEGIQRGRNANDYVLNSKPVGKKE